MTSKRKAQSKPPGKAQLKAQAEAVVEDVRTFDADTRRAVFVALENLKFAETNPQRATEYTDAGCCTSCTPPKRASACSASRTQARSTNAGASHKTRGHA